jgi:hypothetical protein
MTATLKQQVIDTQQWLLQDLGFRIVADDYDGRTMGSSSVELDSTALCVRFVRDPLTIYAEVAPLAEPKGWWELSLVLEAIQGERPQYGRDLQAAASLFRDNLASLTEAMGPRWPHTKQELERRYQLRAREQMISRPVSVRTQLKLERLRWRRPILFLGLAVAAGAVAWIILR